MKKEKKLSDKKNKKNSFKKSIWRKIREKISEGRKKEIKDEKKDIGKFDFSKKNKILILLFLDLLISTVFFIIKNSVFLSLVVFFSLIFLFVFYKIFKKRMEEYNRIKKMENTFPDFLQLVASNLRAGMTIDRALILSAREEFAPLDKEIKAVGKDIVTGKELSVALTNMSERTKSAKIQKTVGLIVRGLRSGGNLSILLEQISENMREKEFIEKKASSNVLMYVIFIFFAVAVGAPVLFGLSSIMVEVLTDLVSSVPEMGGSVETAFTMKEVNISIDFVVYFSIVFMIVTDILASLILGLVNKGKEKEGIKYILPLIVISLTIFFSIRIFLSGFFKGFFG
ncbi:MAG: type II secretion system F family protein [Minisyncoccales bacterium]